MQNKEIKLYSHFNHKFALRVTEGHFATTHSHINYYIDMTTLKVRQSEARSIAKIISKEYITSTYVDTIVCMDGCDIIGAYLAEELNSVGIMSMNQHQTIYIITPEVKTNGQLIFRDNIQPMVRGKHILLLVASTTTGKTIQKSLECIEYYGGIISGISSIFSAIDSVDGRPIHSVFTTKDLPDYKMYQHDECELCKRGEKIDAIVNSYGFTSYKDHVKES
ncbi:hypothetical protein lbkm_0516 [Lachnospiraceae bacterium KM106-2]|nr:hypothetical protein lbkm_0516 [Lachnospiraceae bacterium KM106-2]